MGTEVGLSRGLQRIADVLSTIASDDGEREVMRSLFPDNAGWGESRRAFHLARLWLLWPGRTFSASIVAGGRDPCILVAFHRLAAAKALTLTPRKLKQVVAEIQQDDKLAEVRDSRLRIALVFALILKRQWPARYREATTNFAAA